MDGDPVIDLTSNAKCRCDTKKVQAVAGLLLCPACDVQVISMATTGVRGPVSRDHACSNCAPREG